MSTITVKQIRTQRQSSVNQQVLRQEAGVIKVKHSAPPPRDLPLPPVNSRKISITFLATGDSDHPDFSLRIHTILADTNESFGDIFAKYRQQAHRESDILSFWCRDIAGFHCVWPDQTPYEVFECGSKQSIGAVKPAAHEWKIEVRGWRARDFMR